MKEKKAVEGRLSLPILMLWRGGFSLPIIEQRSGG